jgi:hypothetical protein
MAIGPLFCKDLRPGFIAGNEKRRLEAALFML